MTKTSDTLKVLSNKSFLGLWMSQVFSQFSTNIVNFALIAKIYQITSSSAAVSLLVFWFATPAVLLGILAGVYVDRWDRKKILISINIIQAFLVLGYIFVGNNYILIYPIVFLYAACNQFFLPAEGAMIPTIIKKNLRVAANSFYLFTTYVSFILGYALSGVLMLLWGKDFPFYLASFFLLGATVVVMAVPSDKKRALEFRKSQARKKFFDAVKSGLLFIKTNNKVLYSISHLILVQIVLSALIALGPSFVTQKLDTSVESASFMLVAPVGIGVALGAFVLNKIKKRKNILLYMRNGVIASSFVLFIVSVLPRFGPGVKKAVIDVMHINILSKMNLLLSTSTLIVFFGFFAAFIVIPAQTIIQNETNCDLRGRVFGLSSMLVHVFSLFPLVVFGLLADLLSPSLVFALIALIILLWSLFSQYGVKKGLANA